MLENSIAGLILSLFLSIISPYFKNDPNRELYKIGIVVGVSILLATFQKYAGEDFKQSLLDILGTASIIYAIILKTLDDPIQKMSARYLNK